MEPRADAGSRMVRLTVQREENSKRVMYSFQMNRSVEPILFSDSIEPILKAC